MLGPTLARLGCTACVLFAAGALAPGASADPNARPGEAVRQTLTRVMSVAQSEGARDEKLAALEEEARRLMELNQYHYP